MAESPQTDALTSDPHGIKQVFGDALDQSLKHSSPHLAADNACYAVRSYLANFDAVDLSSKTREEPAYQLTRKRPEKRKG